MPDDYQGFDDGGIEHESPKNKLKRLWKYIISSVSPHHMRPSSRGGQANQYNLFPWRQKSHHAWHFIFFNMHISEVWDRLVEIHEAIFDSSREHITRDWIEVCTLDREEDKSDLEKIKKFNQDKVSFMNKSTDVILMQSKWETCFGSASLERAILVIRYMMLFMIFGEAMANPEEKIFVNSHLEQLLSKVSIHGDRRWALNQCLGENASTHSAKSQISEILDKVGHL